MKPWGPLIGEATLAEIQARLVLVRAWLAPRIKQARHWLIAPREPLTWTAVRARGIGLIHLLSSTYAGRVAAVGFLVILLLPMLLWYAAVQKDDKGAVTYPHAGLINPILAGFGALFLIYAAIRQAQTASRQAQIASDRHEAQTKADLQRRITETFSKAVEQLGNIGMEVRVGGIYTLERLAGEALASPADEGGGPDLYWTVMETLTAFVRERARWQEPEATETNAQSDLSWTIDLADLSRTIDPADLADLADLSRTIDRADLLRTIDLATRPPTDIAAVLEVIRRRPDAGRACEKQRGWYLNARKADLRGAFLPRPHLEGADLSEAHLEGAFLSEAHLEGADLGRAHLKVAFLREAHLQGANLRGAHLQVAALSRAHLEGADLSTADLKSANLRGAHLGVAVLSRAHLEGADLSEAHLLGANLRGAHLKAATLARVHLESADLSEAHLEGADLRGAHLIVAILSGAHLKGADLREVHLRGADLDGAHLEGADLSRAHLEGADLSGAIGDATTRLPDGIVRPAHWPAYAP